MLGFWGGLRFRLLAIALHVGNSTGKATEPLILWREAFLDWRLPRIAPQSSTQPSGKMPSTHQIAVCACVQVAGTARLQCRDHEARYHYFFREEGNGHAGLRLCSCNRARHPGKYSSYGGAQFKRLNRARRLGPSMHGPRCSEFSS